MNRKRSIGLAVVVVGLLVAALGAYTVLAGPSALADDDEDDSMTVTVANATISLNVPGDPGATYFIVIGDITHVDGEEASGTFLCKGVFLDPVSLGLGLPALTPGTPSADGGTFVTQRFLIDGLGSIVGVGTEFSDEPLAVTGGTGRFTGASGNYTGVGLPPPLGTGDLFFEFSLGDGDDDDDDD